MNAVRKYKQKAVGVSLMLLVCGQSIAQVANNNIANRVELKLNSPVHSNTSHASVEWNCINKALTNKCLVYHNDQWFYFTPSTSGTYYVNIASQQCRKRLGVQLIVIEGNPCEVKGYIIKRCIDKIHQSNVFIALDSLKGGTQYLINVDGFLGDFCEFEITFSDKPDGLPESLLSEHTLELKAETKDKLVTLNWRAGLEWVDRVEQFEVYRTKTNESRLVLINKQTVRKNTLGISEADYTYVDTLHVPGLYQYSVLVTDKTSSDRKLLDQVQVKHAFVAVCKTDMPLNFLNPGLLEVTVLDPEKDFILHTFTYDYIQATTLPVDFTKYVRRGTRRFWIKVKQVNTKELQLFAYQVNESGQLQLVGQ